MKHSIATSFLATALGFGLVLSALPVEAGAGKTRPRGKASASRPSAGSSGARASGRASHGGARATGRATYGYGRHGYSRHHHGYGYYSAYYPYAWWGYYGYAWPYYWGYGSGPYYGYPRTEYRDRLSRAPGAVETDVKPRKCDVRLDGEWVGQARDYNGNWDRLIVKPGDHTLEFSAEGYQVLRYHLTVEPGSYHRVAQRLQKGEGLDPRSDPEPPAARPESPASAEAVRGDPGSPGPARLQKALLRIRATPSDAAVYLDGEFLARADELSRLHGALPVAAGDHLIEVVRPGFDSARREVSVGGERPVTVEFELVRQK